MQATKNQGTKKLPVKLPKNWRTKTTFELKLQARLELNNRKLKHQGTNKPPIKLPKNWREMSIEVRH